jgi:hypothetical protein
VQLRHQFGDLHRLLVDSAGLVLVPAVVKP